jgi:dTDP-4-amino-4,6-dideoxygalactose transaminase
MKIPFHRPSIGDEEIASVTECLRGGWLTSGARTVEFEEEFKGYVGARHAIAVSSATAGLHLSLIAAGCGKDDEVLVPAMTHASTAEVVRYVNARPVFVDIERESHCIDASRIEEKITKKTRAIIPVHYAGQPCDMDDILSIAAAHGLQVIEDAAHSLPAWYRDRKIGTIGDSTCFSFYATKTLTTGEGGMICTDDDGRAARMRVLRLHGISCDAWDRLNSSRIWRYDVVETGYKYNMTDMAASIGIQQLKKLELLWERRGRIADRYSAAFRNREDLTPYAIKPDRVSSWHLYPVDLNIDMLSIGRDGVIEQMHARGVDLSVHFIPLYEFSCYKKLGYRGAGFENCAWVFERTVSLPIFPDMSEHEVDYVIQNLLDVLAAFRR